MTDAATAPTTANNPPAEQPTTSPPNKEVKEDQKVVATQEYTKGGEEEGKKQPQTEGVAVKSATAEESSAKKGKDNDDELYPEEELVEGDWMRPQVNLKEVEVKSGEENEETFWQHRAKLYRWVKETSEWKERGLGDAKLLKHKESGRIRFLLRQEKTLKIVANHYVVQSHKFCQLTPNVASDKIWVWTVTDFAEDTPRIEQFGLKFGQVEVASEFKTKFEEAAEANKVPFKELLEKEAKRNEAPAA